MLACRNVAVSNLYTCPLQTFIGMFPPKLTKTEVCIFSTPTDVSTPITHSTIKQTVMVRAKKFINDMALRLGQKVSLIVSGIDYSRGGVVFCGV
jgi:hypothetical protein